MEQPRDAPVSVKRRAIEGAFWTLGGYSWGQLLRLGSHLILAWLLAPEIFGLMALVKVVMQGLQMFSDVGIKPSIIQNRRGADPAFLNTAWTIQVFRGVVLWLIACALAWPVAVWYARNDPAAMQLVYVIPVAAFVSVIAGFASTSLATLNRDLRFGWITSLEVLTQLVSLAVMVGWALIDPSIWAMVAGGLAGALFRTVVSHRLVRDRPVRFQWDRDCVGELFRFGRWIFLSTLFTFLALNLDKIILGSLLTLAELGLYGIAFVFAKVPFYICTRLGGTVLFPVYSTYRDDPKKMVAIALRAREPVLWLGVALCVSMVIGARLFFETLWDDRYAGIVPIAQSMPLYIWTMIILLSMDRIPLALGNSRVLFVSNVLRTAAIVFAIGGYMQWGLIGFIFGLAMGPTIAHLYVLRSVPSQRTALGMQGVWFTLAGLAYAVPAIAIETWAYTQLDPISSAAVVVALAGGPIVLAGLIVLKRMRGTKDKSQPRSPADLKPEDMTA